MKRLKGIDERLKDQTPTKGVSKSGRATFSKSADSAAPTRYERPTEYAPKDKRRPNAINDFVPAKKEYQPKGAGKYADKKPFIKNDFSQNTRADDYANPRTKNVNNRKSSVDFTKRMVPQVVDKTQPLFDGLPFERSYERKPTNPNHVITDKKEDGTMRLNKFLSQAGIAARRKADELIAEGLVKVNNEVITQMGYRIKKGDVVKFNGKIITKPDNFNYILLNKPKNTVTTVHDDRGRDTVMELIERSTPQRVYPVGRLDRNTTGVLLFTNDGELAQQLTHPSSKTEKVYAITLDKALTKTDFDAIRAGFDLEDGFIKVDHIEFPNSLDKTFVGIELHSGRNRIVRRIFESLEYEIIKLDRVVFAGLTKKNLSRGRWRHLTEKEVITLKHFTADKKLKLEQKKS